MAGSGDEGGDRISGKGSFFLCFRIPSGRSVIPPGSSTGPNGWGRLFDSGLDGSRGPMKMQIPSIFNEKTVSFQLLSLKNIKENFKNQNISTKIKHS
jgi:hypothetical protein